MLIFALGSQLAKAAELTHYHRLTLSELEDLADNYPDSVNLKLALARKIGQTDQAAALQLVSELRDQSLDSSERLIVSGYSCELNIKQGLIAAATQFCEQISRSLEQASLTPLL